VSIRSAIIHSTYDVRGTVWELSGFVSTLRS
jgi:hypothetical protein